jgi:hypothetical protein
MSYHDKKARSAAEGTEFRGRSFPDKTCHQFVHVERRSSLFQFVESLLNVHW